MPRGKKSELALPGMDSIMPRNSDRKIVSRTIGQKCDRKREMCDSITMGEREKRKKRK